MSLPRFYEFYGPFIKGLSDGQMHTMREIKKYVASSMGLSDADLATTLPSGSQTIFDNRIGWARTYLKKAGLIISPSRGVFQLTDNGKSALPDADSIDNAYLMRYQSFQEFVSRDTTTGGDSLQQSINQSPDEILADAYNTIQSSLADDLMQEILKLSPTDFEKLAMKLLRKMGYGSGLDEGYTVTQASNDGGIDGYIEEDPLGCSTICYQAKQWDPSRTVDRPEIQKFVGAITMQHRATKGLFITTAKFSSGAKASAEVAGIVLIDGETLTKLMINYNLGVSVQRTYEVKKIDTDFFNDDF